MSASPLSVLPEVEDTSRMSVPPELALTVTLTPKAITPEDLDALRRPGLADADILEAIETSFWFNHTNRIFISLGVVPDQK
jgi:alkylhydroperoxidase family enzyme